MKLITYITYIVLFFQAIDGFCVANQLDRIYFTVIDARDDVRLDKIFQKEVHPGNVECCHYSNRDCSSQGRDDEPSSFHITYGNAYNNIPTKRQRVNCTTGGGLTVTGDDRKIEIYCKFANGTTTIVKSVDDEIKPFTWVHRPN